MTQFEYKVVPAPSRGEKIKGVKEAEMRFAQTVEGVLNRMAQDGWEFVRAEMLPSEERSGLSRSSKEWRNLLIFRRASAEAGLVRPDMPPLAVPADPPPPPAKAGKKGPRIRTPMARKADAAPRRVGTPFDRDDDDGLPPRKDPPASSRSGAGPDSGPDFGPETDPVRKEDDFDVRSVDDAAEAGPFRSLRERN
ncbi:MAG: DUF4177 domain-containing protein [Marinibacterium sp.]